MQTIITRAELAQFGSASVLFLSVAACSGGANNASTGTGGGSTSSSSASTTSSGGGTTSNGSTTASSASSGTAGMPASFWDTSDIPPAKNVLTIKFLNRTNGKYPDSQVFWSFKQDTINEVHSIAEMPTYDMPASASGRMYFYLEQPNGKYYDFIEHTIGAAQYNGNTTRVDAFGLKIAIRLHCADGYDIAVGDAYELFQEDRDATFQRFQSEVPDEFKHLAQIQAPYRIVQPGAGEFKTGGMYEHYYDASADAIWAANGLTFAKPGPNGSGLGSYPNVSAALMRHVGADAGSFSADGKLLAKDLWQDASTFYKAPPADYYAKFWHDHGIDGKAYGFPYDDVGSYSTYISHKDPQYLLVAIGW